MKEGLTYKIFADCVDKVPKQKQVKSKDYQSSGKYPIVSQEKELISGYWDDESYLFRHKKPIIIFGDHTKEIKYIDFDFVVGADGTQILSPKDTLDARFFYYALVATPIRTLGYARHFKLLKEKYFPVPSLSEQQAIVSRLDSAFAQIDALKANAEKQLEEARKLFQAELTETMKPKEGWEEKKLGELCYFSQGVQVPLPEQSAEKKEGYLRFLRIIDFTQGNEPPRYIPITDQKYWMNGDEIAIVRYGASTGFICTGLEGMLANNMFKVNIRKKKNLSSAFLIWYLRSDFFQLYIKKEMNGAAMPAISFGMINEIIVSYPSITIQHQIVSRLDALSANIKRLEELQQKTLKECDALKQAMLREVFE